MRRLTRTVARFGQNNDIWPIAFLLFAVLVPAVCLLWFMAAALRNERLAARQKFADIYRSQLSSLQVRLERHWKEKSSALEQLVRIAPSPVAFVKCVQSGIVDSVILLDGEQILYPNTPSLFPSPSGELERNWAEASQLEYLRKDFIAAANHYDEIARQATNASIAARAFQAEARCFVRARNESEAIRVISQLLGGERYDHATDSQGRLIVANAELMVLELLTNHASSIFQSTALRLKQRLTDYENPGLAASQRRFLMKELQRLAPQIEFPTLAAEELAAEFSPISQAKGRAEFSLHRSSLPDVWQFTTPDRRALALIRLESVLATLKSVMALDKSPAEAEVTLLPPEADNTAAFVALPAGAQLPGWRLSLSLKNQKFFDTTLAHQTGVYFWTGILVMAVMGVLTLLAIRLVRRETALARLKNDLAATVSHELKTPLASMHVLVDTLLDSDKIHEKTAREYLQLIAHENERLSRLIQNFLTFSRMEHKKYSFAFTPLPPRQIVDSAVQTVRERFNAPGCCFEVQVEDSLPDMMADADALTTALINLFENAYKYTQEIKHIMVRVHLENGFVVFSVRDNGIGIAPHEAKRVFRPFHQVDQRLSRNSSGCGLGLSIVQFIVAAHHGRVSLESQPGCGSTFTIFIPAAPATAGTRKEAVA